MLNHVTQKLRVHQYHDCVQPHDAVTNQMRFLKTVLRDAGISGEIFSRHIKPQGWSEAQPFHANRVWDCDLLLIHHSQGSPLLSEVLKIEVPKALVYHNITPSYFFNHDPYLRDLCQLGRAQLLQMRPQLIAAFADSKFNATELEELGYSSPQLLPLFDLGACQITTRKPRTPRHLIFVGKITPHKNQALLIKTLFYLNLLWEKKAKLTLVGGEDPIYGRYVRHLVKALGLETVVTFTGKIDDEALREHFRLADAFLSTSLHEGYGVPLVEAMRAGLPVFALSNSAVPETVKGAGVLLETQKPHHIANIIATVLADPKAVALIQQSQKKRLQELEKEQSRQKVLEPLVPLVRSLRKIPSPATHSERTLDASP